MGEFILDCDSIKILRRSQAMSQRQLGRALGVSQTVVRNIELGENHQRLTLRMAARLAEVLGADLRDIMPRRGDVADPTSDDIRVEALLTDERRPLTTQEIAAAFDWPLRRAHQALRQLRGRLQSGGTRLHTASDSCWKIAPHHGVISATDRERLARARLPRRGMTITEARVLRQVVAGLVDQTWEGRAKRNEVGALGGLFKMGLVITNEYGATVMHPKTERSLHLPQQPPRKLRCGRRTSKRRAE